MATATATMPSIGTVGSTMVLFYPVPTPWPISAGCDERIHREANNGVILAYDPVYARLMSETRRPSEEWAESCYPVHHQAWWFQAATATPSTVLGPTFVCPESYTAVHSTVVGSDAVARTEYTYCCPPNFTLNIVFPQNQRGDAQWYHLHAPRRLDPSLPHLPHYHPPSPNSQTIAAWTRTTTLVVSSAATVSGGGVNGYNIVPLRQLDSPQSPSTTAHTTGPLITGSGGTGNAGNNGGGGSNMPPSSGDLSPGTIGGIAVGVGLFVLLVVAACWLWHRGRNKSKAEQRRTPPANYPGTLVSRWLDNVSGTQGQAQWR